MYVFGKEVKENLWVDAVLFFFNVLNKNKQLLQTPMLLPPT